MNLILIKRDARRVRRTLIDWTTVSQLQKVGMLRTIARKQLGSTHPSYRRLDDAFHHGGEREQANAELHFAHDHPQLLPEAYVPF